MSLPRVTGLLGLLETSLVPRKQTHAIHHRIENNNISLLIQLTCFVTLCANNHAE